MNTTPHTTVIWVATLNEDYQPTPAAAYVAIGPRSIPQLLDQFTKLVNEREHSTQPRRLWTATPNSPRLLLVVDPDLDVNDLSKRVAVVGDRVGVGICRAVIG